ncbi:MAG: hypothetical protein ACI9CF_000382 [Candidatus Omnitrophota bacterium]|jgi:hypothetical protein
MTAQNDIINAIESFQNYWILFKKECMAQPQVAFGNDQNSFEKINALAGLKKRFNDIASAKFKPNVSDGMRESISLILGIDDFNSLSDERLRDFDRASQVVDREINQWIDSLQRKKSVSGIRTQRKIKSRLSRFVTIPVVFGTLLILLLVMSIRYYLGR